VRYEWRVKWKVRTANIFGEKGKFSPGERRRSGTRRRGEGSEGKEMGQEGHSMTCRGGRTGITQARVSYHQGKKSSPDMGREKNRGIVASSTIGWYEDAPSVKTKG